MNQFEKLEWSEKFYNVTILNVVTLLHVFMMQQDYYQSYNVWFMF